MPFHSIDELPSNVKRFIPSVEGRTLFMRVFNNAFEKFQDEVEASNSAWNALKLAGYKRHDVDGRWRKSLWV